MSHYGTACVASRHIARPPRRKTHLLYKCVHVSDPHAKHWLADDSNFLASLNELDRGLNASGRGSDDVDDVAVAPPAVSPATVMPPRSAAARAARPINAARALDPARVLDTMPRPLAAPPSAAVAPIARDRKSVV